MGTPGLFVTETMAELCARQGRGADAVAIYRELLAAGGGDDLTEDERRERWRRRLETLEAMAAARAAGAAPPAAAGAGAAAAEAPAAPVVRLPMTVRTPVRSGQVVYAEGGDLVVLAPVNPGAQVIADGNIHVYAPLRGRAVAGARGCADARIFCQRLDAELVGIGAAYVAAEDLPAERIGKPAQVRLDGERCVVGGL